MIFDHDVIVIGSGFGGSVSALRLVEKGYDVGVLEAGPRFEDQGFAKNSWDTKRFLFAPSLGMYGIQRISALRDVIILSGAGVGGGSLVYANTLYEPLPAFYADKQWAHITDWKAELAPYYDQAKRMLGVTTYPGFTPADKVMKQVADDMGVGETFHPTPVGVFFGEPGVEVDDPYFGGAGPRRSGCIDCGECMTGCRHNAKNTLTKNYLYLAEKAGAEVYPMTTVTSVEELPGGGYAIETRRTSNKKTTRKFTAQQVIFAASALGTAKLLHRLRDEGKLPHLSDRLGVLTRTNSESLLGAIARDRDIDYTKGVAITSSFHPDDITHIEPVRYGRGSNVMSLLQTVLTDGGGDKPRWRTWLRELAVQRRADRDRAGDADRGQLDHHLWQTGSPRPLAADLEAGPRCSEPVLDPGRQRGGPADGEADGRDAGRHDRRTVQRADDRTLHRRLRDRRLGRDRCGRPVPPGLRVRGAAHRGRLDHLGEPGRQSVPDDHGAGRAGVVVLAEQG